MNRAIIISVFFYAFTLSGCTPENVDNPTQAEEIMVTFDYGINSYSTVATRTDKWTDEQEVRVTAVYVFVYEQVGNVEYLRYYRKGENFSSGAQGGSFDVRLMKSRNNEKYTFDLFFNMQLTIESTINYSNGEAITNPCMGTFLLGDTRADVHKALVINSVPSFSTNTGLYMWAGSDVAQPVVQGMNLPPFQTVRTHARFDVGLNVDSDFNPQGLSHFKLTHAYVYSQATRGAIVPARPTLNGNEVTAQTLPTDYGHTYAGNATTGTNSGYNFQDNVYRGIYTYEADPTIITNSTYGSHYGLVIGGLYGQETTTSYYFIDLKDPDDPDKLLFPIRNHLYQINITEVNGPGLPTATAAAYSGKQSDHINYTITTINGDGKYNYFASDGHWFIGLSQLAFNFTPTSDSSSINLYTNFNTGSVNNGRGWKIISILNTDGSDASDWVIFPITSDNSGYNKDVVVNFSVTSNNTGNPRKAYVRFVGGNAYLDVEINQSL